VAKPFCGEVFVEGMQGEVGLRHQDGRCQRPKDDVHFFEDANSVPEGGEESSRSFCPDFA
jgi:hypothetical protein